MGDLNRNWGFHWAETGVSFDPCSEVYCGSAPFDQPESANIRDFVLTLDPVPVLGHTFHSYSQLWLWPYDLEQITAYWTNDNTVVINTPQVRLVHQGKTVTLEVNNTPNRSQCGLCGDYNMDKRTDVLSSKGCIMSSVKLAAHTYRSKSEQCR